MTQKPNSDQASKGSLAGSLGDYLQRWLRDELDDSIPARVVSYDDATNRAVIQPLVMVGTTGGDKVARAAIPNIPVFRFGGGGFFIRFPLKPGNVGWLKANDRDISLVMQAGGGQDWPNTKRLHSFSDAMFYPDTFKQWVIAAANADAAVFQSLDGTQCLALREAEIEITSGETCSLLMTPTSMTQKVGTNTIVTTPASIVQTVGASTITTTAAGVAIVSPSLTHNGKEIGSTHYHVGSPDTAVPV
jgi:hypothetical protein